MAITFLSFLMKLFLLPTERNNKIRKRQVFRATRLYCVGGVPTNALADRLAAAPVGSDSLLLPSGGPEAHLIDTICCTYLIN